MTKKNDTNTDNMETGDLVNTESPTPVSVKEPAPDPNRMVHALCCVKMLVVNDTCYRMHDIMYVPLSELEKVDEKSYRRYKE